MIFFGKPFDGHGKNVDQNRNDYGAVQRCQKKGILHRVIQEGKYQGGEIHGYQ
jgi:hypothetical protein